MRVTYHEDEDGRRSSFEVTNFLVGRRGIAKVVDGIPGVHIIERPKRFDLSRAASESFCVFELGGERFEVLEPYGDSDCYWVVAQEGGSMETLSRVAGAFAGARVLFDLVL